MINPSNIIEQRIDRVVDRTAIIIRAMQLHGATIKLSVTPEALETKLAGFAGSIGGEGMPILGKLNEANQAVYRADAARDVRDLAESTAKTLRFDGKNLVMHYLGKKWSLAWAAAGFTAKSLECSGDPVKGLTELLGYFRTFPEHENQSLGLTAENIQATITAVNDARFALRHAAGVATNAIAERDVEFQSIRKILTSIRTELRCHLSDSDTLWYDYTFKRPVDGRFPVPVEGLIQKPGVSGEVIAEWQPSRRAKSYHVTYAPLDSNDPAIDAGSTIKPEIDLKDLTPGMTVVVSVAPVNRAGEAVATKAEIRVL